ncbi:MAG TPA: ABC transporter permease [Vicinamibacterales bacterium]|nr:ABC transporter permease [Vicinamibacterales bacterium]
MIEAVLKDVAYAARALRRSPGFFAVAVLSLGLGVGVNTAMFSLVDALLFRPLPVHDPGTLVDLFTTDGDEFATSSYADYLDIKAQNTVFADMTGYSPMMAPLALGDRSRVALGQIVTGNHFTMLGVQPALGRLLAPADDTPGAARVVVLSDRMWRREYGADPAIVGRTITLRGLVYTVAGVAPPSFTGVVPLLTPELWLPMAHAEEVDPVGITSSVPGPGRTRLERRGARWMFVKGRLKDGVTPAQAQANVALIGTQLAAAYPQTNKDARFSAVPSEDVRLLVPQAGDVLSVGAAGVMLIVGLVLLIACANVAGMLLARSSARGREISVRLAIGASRRRLVQQLLVEGLVLGTLGAVVSLGLAWVAVRALVAVELPLPFDVVLDLRLDWRVAVFALAAAAATGLLASLVPALKASRPDLVSDLRGETPAARVGGRRWALRDALVVAQVALTAVLLVVAGLLLRSLGASERADVGFEPRGLAAVAFDTDMMRYEPARGLEFWRMARDRIAALPEVSAVGTVSPTLPFTLNFSQQEMKIDTRTYVEGQRGETIENVAISPGYLATLGVRLVEGRDIVAADTEGAPDVAIVNETMARQFWPGASPVGHTVTMASTGRVFRVVGVNADHKQHGVLERPAPFVYFAAAQRSSTYNFLVARTSGDASALVSAMRRELLALEPGLVVMDASTMESHMAAALLPARVGALLAGAFGGLGTLLAAIGLYGVIAFSVARRTKEIGLRMALGAVPSGVMTMVMRQGLTLVAVGLAVGAGLAAGVAFLLRGLLYGVTPLDPWAWAAAVLALALAGALANAVPARRAMRVEPLTALRTD